MMKTKRILAMTAVAVVAAQTSFAQTTTPTTPMTPPPAPAPINLDFLSTLFSGTTTPDEAGILSAFSTAGLTVERYRSNSEGEIRVRATTADGQEVRVRIEDGQVRYSVRSNGDSSGDNGSDSTSSDANGDDSGDNGGSSRGGNDDNGGNSGGGNGGNS